MYNLRYHIASLVGVFLALSLGLLLGTVVAERGTLDDQRDSLINSLERDFAELSESNTRLSAENESQAGFILGIVPALVDGSLEGKTVAVLSNSGRSDGTSAIQEAIKAGGGSVITLVMEMPGLGMDDPKTAAAVAPYIDKGGDPVAEVASALASEWTTVGPRPVTNALVKSGALRASELLPEVAVESIVFTANWEGKPDAMAVEIGRGILVKGGRAVGAQATSLDTGVAAAALDRGLNAVDQMGTPQGAYSLVWILAGRASGYYGLGSGAQAAYPAP
ncbi:MAG: copper transporter [Coriobacteriia bacterium]|nr:copper transporter [Coriobacteriia bacterium]